MRLKVSYNWFLKRRAVLYTVLTRGAFTHTLTQGGGGGEVVE